MEMKSTFKVVKHETYHDVLTEITLENGDNLMIYVSDLDDVIYDNHEIEVTRNGNTYLMTNDKCKPKISLIEKLSFIKLS